MFVYETSKVCPSEIFDEEALLVRKVIVMVQKSVSVMLEKTREEAEVVLGNFC